MYKKLFLTAALIGTTLLTVSSCSSFPFSSEIASDDNLGLDRAQTHTTIPDSSTRNSPSSDPDQSRSANHTPTPDIRSKPEDWQNWPVVPTLSPRMIEIYTEGINQGNLEDAFSKVGDCQIIPEVFLGVFDNETYLLPEGREHLQDTLDRFQGSFGREGYSLKGGFVFPTVFSPLRADSSVCEPGETPYECELRVHHPSFVLISMEFRYDGRTADTHEKYLRRAVEYALDRNIVPILATKADNFEGDHSLNLITAQIAYEYDLPLWNYWKAVQHLPDHGIDWERDSYGFHVTPAAWWVRSITFLEVLDSLLADIQGKNLPETALLQPTSTPSPTARSSPDSELDSRGTAVPLNQDRDWGQGQLVFDLKERGFGEINYLGVFIADLSTGKLKQISSEGSQLLGVSPDYQLILSSSGTSLNLIDLGDYSSWEISNSLFESSPAGALWDRTSGDIYFITSTGDQTELYRYNYQTGAQKLIPALNPISLMEASSGVIVWGQGTCNPFGNCNFESLHWSDKSGNELASRDIGDRIMLPCQTAAEFVYAERDQDNGLSFHIQSLDSGSEITFWALNTEYSDCDWSPTEEEIAVTLIDRGWYSGVIQEHYFQILSLENNQIRDLSFVYDLLEQVAWSPDGKFIAYSGTAQIGDLYQTGLGILELETLDTQQIGEVAEILSENYLNVADIYWLP